MKKSKKFVNRFKFFSIFLMLAFLLSGSLFRINAEFLSGLTLYTVEDISASTSAISIPSQPQQIFFNSNNNRWYILYSYEIGASDDYGLKYSYSDASDPTSWNNGGALTAIGELRDVNQANRLSVGYHYAWTYDPDADIVHLVYMKDETADGASEEVNYRNMTVETDGSLTLGSEKTLWDFSASSYGYGSVDICLNQDDSRPIVAACFQGFSGSILYYHYAWICDSTDGHSGSWSGVYYQPQFSRPVVAVVPMESNSCLLISASGIADAPLRRFEINFGSTSNSSGQGSTFSDLNAGHLSTGGDSQLLSFYGVSYNSSHGTVSYQDESSEDTYTFIFDFATLTRSTEYETFEDSNDHYYMTGVAVQDNEFFILSSMLDFGTSNSYIVGNEQNNASYSGLFNKTAELTLSGAIVRGDVDVFGANIYRFVSSGNNTLVMVIDDDTIKAGTVQLNGEYAPEIPAQLSDSDVIWLWLTDRTSLWMGLAGAVLMILSPLFMVKSFKDGDPQGFAIALLIMTIVGFSLVIGWLYG